MRTILIPLLLPALAPAAIISSTFAPGVDNDWNTIGNWSPIGVPSNNATDQFNVTIPAGAGAILDLTASILQLDVGTGGSLTWTSGRTLTSSGDISNNGLLELIGASTLTRLTVNDPSDNLVNLTGSGTIRLTAAQQSITGLHPTVLSIGTNQRIEGFGSLSNNTVDLVNGGTLAGDSSSGPLAIDPRTTFQNSGSVVAEANGSLTLKAGLYTGAGAYRIDDFGAMNLTGPTLENITLSVDNNDGDLFNNVATVTSSTIIKEFTNEANISTNSGVLLTLGGDVTNNGIIELNGATTNSRLSVNDLVDQNITINGTGNITLNDPLQRIQGTTGSLLTFGSGQTLRGTGNVGTNLLNIVNQGTIIADSSGSTLTLDPAATFINSGSIRAESGGVARFNAGTYSGTGSFIISDGSVFELSGGTFENLSFTSDNLDAMPENNLISIVGNSTFDGITSNATIDIPASRLLTLVDDLTNHGHIQLNGTSSNGRISINDNDDQDVLLGGTGTVQLTNLAQNITGSTSHTLTIGNSQTIHGTGRIGVNQLNLVNQGTLSADVPGEGLELDPSSTFLNSGTIEAIGGGNVKFNGGSYTGSGSFLIGDSSSFTLLGATFSQLTFSADDQDAMPENNQIILNGNPTFNGITSDATIDIPASRSLTLVDDFTNHGHIQLNGTSSNGRLSINDPDDQTVLLDGTGTVQLTNLAQNITGSTSHTLTIGPSQTIHGTGKIGVNQLNLVNQGTIRADDPASELQLDPSTSLENPGTLVAAPGCTLTFNAGTYTGAGLFSIPDTARFKLSGGTYQDLLFSNGGNDDGDLTNNDVDISSNVTFENVTNHAAINILEAKSITLAGDNTNHGLIELNSTSTFTRISVTDPVDQAVLLDGAGTIRLTADQQSITGSNGQLFTNGPLHTIEGFGKIGSNLINVANQGTLHANASGQTLLVEPATSFSNTGTLMTDAGATLSFVGTGNVNETTGTLSGNGTVATSSGTHFTNHGTIAPGTSIGSLTIEEMSHSATAKWQFEFESTAGPGTGHDALHIDGDLALNGLLIPQLVGPFVPNPSDTFVIITATGDITGDFTVISQPAGLGSWTATVDEINDQVILSFVEDTTLDFAEYQALYFTAQQIADGDADPDADFDGDGLNTFLEWIHGFDPTSPVIPVPPLAIAKTGSFVDLTYPESALLPENSYLLEVESDLDLQAPWTTIPGIDSMRLPGIPSPGNPNINEVTLRISDPAWTSDPTRFFRLRYTDPAPSGP